TPLGPATERLAVDRGDTLHIQAWGPGAEWLAEWAPALVGEHDDDSDFRPEHPLIRDLWRLHPGLRIPRSGAVFEAAMGSILEQMVPGAEAWQGWRALVRDLGEPAPGPQAGLFVAPDPAPLAPPPYHAFPPPRIPRRPAEAHRPPPRRATGSRAGRGTGHAAGRGAQSTVRPARHGRVDSRRGCNGRARRPGRRLRRRLPPAPRRGVGTGR